MIGGKKIIMAAAGATAGGGGWNPGLLTDPDVVALWNFEPGALEVDSVGGNTLVNAGPVSDAVNFKQGIGSSYHPVGERYNLNDADLDSGFPTKYGETNRSFSVCFWTRILDGIGISAYPFYKGSSWYVYHQDTIRKFGLWMYLEGSSTLLYPSGLVTVHDRWYHIAITVDGGLYPSSWDYRMRIWDDTSADFACSDLYGSTTKLLDITTGQLRIGQGLYGNTDEMVVFKRALTTAHIDQIRQGTYGS